ncbi:amidase [Geminicoccaceae bacterium 1502E]|nr:amidase [Geminicoccaceae bacterium 1502E]
MSDLAFRPAVELARLVRAREVGALELLEHHIERVERLDGEINAVCVRDFERARADASKADEALARGETIGPLHGVPMTVKESFDIEGHPTTWGLPEYKDHRASRDSLAVERFRKAGAVVFGKTNVPVMLSDWQSFNPVYGTTSNPWDLARGPGGSSGGSAAALAAGMSALEAGSDIGASIRNPAHYCGVYGHKPTFGICSKKGHALGGNVAQGDISVVGPLARTAGDLDLALSVMAGPDEIDGTGWRLELPEEKRSSLKDFKVAVVLDDAEAPVDGAVSGRLQALADFLAAQGATVSTTARPALDSAAVHALYLGLLRSATSGRLPPEQLARFEEIARNAPADEEGYLARAARAALLPHRLWLPLDEQRHRMRLVWASFFEEWDLLLCPAAATAAFPHNQEGERQDRMIPVNGRPQPSTTQLFWAGYSGVFFLPSTVAPNGLSPEGLPVGVQIVAPQYHDRRSIHFAKLLERAWCGFQVPTRLA